MPHAREPGALQHPCDGVLADTGDEPDGQHAERPIARCGEARREQGKQTGERTGYRDHGGDLLGGKGRAARKRPTAFCLLGAHRSGSPPTLLPGRLTRGRKGAHPSRAPAAVRPPAGGRQRSSHRAAAALTRARDTTAGRRKGQPEQAPNGSPLTFRGGGYGAYRGGATAPTETDGDGEIRMRSSAQKRESRGWRVPTQYAQCVSSVCSSPEYKRFRRGESVAVDVSTTDDTAFADSTARIT